MKSELSRPFTILTAIGIKNVRGFNGFGKYGLYDNLTASFSVVRIIFLSPGSELNNFSMFSRSTLEKL